MLKISHFVKEVKACHKCLSYKHMGGRCNRRKESKCNEVNENLTETYLKSVSNADMCPFPGRGYM